MTSREAQRAYSVRHRQQIRERDRRRMADRRSRLAEIKMASGCVECGFNAHPAALDFDHRDPLLKSFDISSRRTNSWDRVLAEVAKCDVLCANCHRIRTAMEDHAAWQRRGAVSDPQLLLFEESA